MAAGTGALGRSLDLASASLVAASVALRAATAAPTPSQPQEEHGTAQLAGSASASWLRCRFLAAFWCFRMADWLQGPYFFEVYASKVFGGEPASEALISRLFLTSFAVPMLLAGSLGRLGERLSQRLATVAGAAFGALSALSVKASSLPALFAGRAAGGCSFLLLSSAPESWLAEEQARGGHRAEWLSETLGLAYLGNSMAAVIAGQLAGMAAARGGPTAPFSLSQAFLMGGAGVVAGSWGAQGAVGQAGGTADKETSSLEAWRAVCKDPKVLGLGAVQALFESAMYVFVTQWPPALKAALPGADPPFGKVFSCFMASSMLGSSAFGRLARGHSAERLLVGACAGAAAAMGAVVAAGRRSLAVTLGGFLVYEACVGVYFPAIGTLRSKYLPDEHRSAITSMFCVAPNLLVMAAMLSVKRLGVRGSLACSAAALQCAFLVQTLVSRASGDLQKQAASIPSPPLAASVKSPTEQGA